MHDHYENWGGSGASNQYIFNALIECHLKNKICKQDRVLIMWTNVCREDRYYEGRWDTPGNAYGQNPPHTSRFDVRGFYIRDLATMWATKRILETLECDFDFFSMVDIQQPNQYSSEQGEGYHDLFEHYQDLLNTIKPSVYTSIFQGDWFSRDKNKKDPHPLPCEHLEYLEFVRPDILIDDRTRRWVNDVHQAVIQERDYEDLYTPCPPRRW